MTNQPRNRRGRFTVNAAMPDGNRAVNDLVRNAAGYGPDPEPRSPPKGMNAAIHSAGEQNPPLRMKYQPTSLAARQRRVAARIFNRKPDSTEETE
jgi:hypothetical protein